jgi:amino acid transporter
MKKDEGLVRGITLPGAISLNMINMIGVGPFVTLPLIVLAMHGPQAILGWILGAVLAACDGLVWAELGAAMPKAGGSYEYLRTIYGPRTTGRYLSFLYIWQLSFSAPLSIASDAWAWRNMPATFGRPCAKFIFRINCRSRFHLYTRYRWRYCLYPARWQRCSAARSRRHCCIATYRA